MLLEALAACAGVTLRAVATSLGIEVEGGKVVAEGDLDFRGTLAVDRDAPVGFRAIRLRFDLRTEADEEELATLLKLTERYCVVFQTLARDPRADRRDRHRDGLTRRRSGQDWVWFRLPGSRSWTDLDGWLGGRAVIVGRGTGRVPVLAAGDGHPPLVRSQKAVHGTAKCERTRWDG